MMRDLKIMCSALTGHLGIPQIHRFWSYVINKFIWKIYKSKRKITHLF